MKKTAPKKLLRVLRILQVVVGVVLLLVMARAMKLLHILLHEEGGF
ncbi:MAG: hypothetical protein GF344_17485 [Chitinivibrionales bacterium]|nr:hypothetical protein [Chitinivibrionales bacterium]MBD3358458.1 hypothetical protein [Chitinivibrionales bacterium]